MILQGRGNALKISNFHNKSEAVYHLLKHLFLIFIVFIVLVPILGIVLVSLSQTGNMTSFSFSDISGNNWKYILGIPYTDLNGQAVTSPYPILLWIGNSIKVSAMSSILMLFFSTTAAYSLSRMNFKGKQSSLKLLMLLQMFPNMMAMVAFYFILDYIGQSISWLGVNTHGGLLLIYLGGTPFNIWMLKGYFDTLPKSLEESAILDGCQPWQIFYKIILPLSAPMLAVVGLLTFIATFSDFILPSILLKSQENMTFAVGIQMFISESFSGRWGPFAAASILGALPIVVLFFSLQKYIVSGLSQGSTKS